MDIIISIIVPFYNVEKYIKRCIISILNQTFFNFEVILIDDGSTDDSYEIVHELVLKKHNFRIFRQNNLGVAKARNLGLKMAKGRFIAFVDGDDYIDKYYLEKLYTYAVNNKADIVCCNFYWVYNKIKLNNYINCKQGIFNNLEALKMLISDTFIQSYMWNKLYRRELFDSLNITFPDMYFEDIAICPKLFYKAKRIMIINDALYFYTQRRDSILHNYNLQTQSDYLKAYVIINNFIYSHSLNSKLNMSYDFLTNKVKIVMIISLLFIHIRKKSFHNLLINYRRAFYIINLCKKPIEDKTLEMLLKKKIFKIGNK